MIYLLDTNVWVAFLRQSRPNVVERLENVPATDVALCSIVLAELYFGAARSAPNRQAANRELISWLREQFASLPFDDLAAEICGQLQGQLADAGTPIGPNDLLIASIALANDLTLVTNNTAEFGRVPDLKLEDWQGA